MNILGNSTHLSLDFLTYYCILQNVIFSTTSVVLTLRKLIFKALFSLIVLKVPLIPSSRSVPSGCQLVGKLQINPTFVALCGRYRRRCCRKAGDASTARSAKAAVSHTTKAAWSCATNATSASTSTASTLRWKRFRRERGSASGVSCALHAAPRRRAPSTAARGRTTTRSVLVVPVSRCVLPVLPPTPMVTWYCNVPTVKGSLCYGRIHSSNLTADWKWQRRD